MVSMDSRIAGHNCAYEAVKAAEHSCHESNE
jgi:hypothetical protein